MKHLKKFNEELNPSTYIIDGQETRGDKLNEDGGTYGNIEYIIKGGVKWINSKDLAKWILGPNGVDYDTFQEWLTQVANAGG